MSWCGDILFVFCLRPASQSNLCVVFPSPKSQICHWGHGVLPFRIRAGFMYLYMTTECAAPNAECQQRLDFLWLISLILIFQYASHDGLTSRAADIQGIDLNMLV